MHFQNGADLDDLGNILYEVAQAVVSCGAPGVSTALDIVNFFASDYCAIVVCNVYLCEEVTSNVQTGLRIECHNCYSGGNCPEPHHDWL